MTGLPVQSATHNAPAPPAGATGNNSALNDRESSNAATRIVIDSEEARKSHGDDDGTGANHHGTNSATTADSQQPNNAANASLAPWPRKPERMGAVDSRLDYVIDDCAEMKLNMNSYRMVFVMNKDVLFYKHNSLAKSRKVRNSDCHLSRITARTLIILFFGERFRRIRRSRERWPRNSTSTLMCGARPT